MRACDYCKMAIERDAPELTDGKGHYYHRDCGRLDTIFKLQSQLATQTKRANIAENRLAVLIGWQCEDKATTLAEVDKEIENKRKGKDNKGN